MKRTQIYLDEEQDKLLGERASESGRTKSELIREALDRYLGRARIPHGDKMRRWREAVRATAGIAPYLPSSAEWIEQRRRETTERDRMLAEHWRR